MHLDCGCFSNEGWLTAGKAPIAEKERKERAL